MKPTTALPTTLIVKGVKCHILLCQCVRCGNIWKPRKPSPAKCPACFSPLWNKERVYSIEGADAPTQVPKPRGKPFEVGFDARRERNSEESPSGSK